MTLQQEKVVVVDAVHVIQIFYCTKNQKWCDLNSWR